MLSSPVGMNEFVTVQGMRTVADDKKLMNKIKKQIESKKEENLDISYAIYPTDYEYDIGYVIERTPHIQN